MLSYVWAPGVNLTEDDRTTEEIIRDRKREVETGELEPSIVVPVNQAFKVAQKVLPDKQVLEILEKAELIGLIDCYCRDKEKNCDAPVEVCIVVDSYARKHLEKGEGRKIGLDEAKDILNKTAEVDWSISAYGGRTTNRKPSAPAVHVAATNCYRCWNMGTWRWLLNRTT